MPRFAFPGRRAEGYKIKTPQKTEIFRKKQDLKRRIRGGDDDTTHRVASSEKNRPFAATSRRFRIGSAKSKCFSGLCSYVDLSNVDLTRAICFFLVYTV